MKRNSRFLSTNPHYFYFAEEFDNYMQQDAHEFLNFLINRISEIILGKTLITVDLCKINHD